MLPAPYRITSSMTLNQYRDRSGIAKPCIIAAIPITIPTRIWKTIAKATGSFLSCRRITFCSNTDTAYVITLIATSTGQLTIGFISLLTPYCKHLVVRHLRSA